MGGDDDPLQRAFAPLIGLPAWSVQKGQGSFLTMEFGQPHLLIREPTVSQSQYERVRARMAQRMVKPVGEWHLWIYCCHWRGLSKGAEIACSEDPDEKIAAAAQELDGQKLTAIEADPAAGTSRFSFDLGVSLLTWPYDDEDNDEQWLLDLPSGDVFTYRADGYYSLGSGKQKEDEMIWLPLPSPAPRV